MAEILRPTGYDPVTGRVKVEAERKADDEPSRVVTGLPVVISTDEKYAVQWMLIAKVEDTGKVEKPTDAIKVDTKTTDVFTGNPSAVERIIVNDADTTLYLKYGDGCTVEDYTMTLPPGGQYRVDSLDMYRGIITATRKDGAGRIMRTER